MPFFRLRVIDDAYVTYDGNEAFLVTAKNEQQARMLCNMNSQREGRIWLNEEFVSCEELEDTSVRNYPQIYMRMVFQHPFGCPG